MIVVNRFSAIMAVLRNTVGNYFVHYVGKVLYYIELLFEKVKMGKLVYDGSVLLTNYSNPLSLHVRVFQYAFSMVDVGRHKSAFFDAAVMLIVRL